MAKPFDATAKKLLEIDPAAWLACAGLHPDGPVRVVDSDVSTVTAEADTVLQVGDPPAYLAHLELQSGRDRSLSGRLLRYNVLLNYRHGLPVRSIAVLLRPQADGPELDGRHQIILPEGDSYLDFDYAVVRVWTLDVEALLQGGTGTLPLAPLAGVTEADLPGVIGRMKQRLDRDVSEELAGLLWSATNILMGLKFTQELSARLLEGVRAMKESVTYQAILEEGRVKGLDQGRDQGRIIEAKDVILQLGRKRLGPPEQIILAKIEAMTELGQLKLLIDRLDEVTSWNKLLGLG